MTRKAAEVSEEASVGWARCRIEKSRARNGSPDAVTQEHVDEVLAGWAIVALGYVEDIATAQLPAQACPKVNGTSICRLADSV